MRNVRNSLDRPYQRHDGLWLGPSLLLGLVRRSALGELVRRAGRIFSGRVQALVEILGNLAWVIVGLTAAVLVGWQLLRYLRPVNAVKSGKSITGAAA